LISVEFSLRAVHSQAYSKSRLSLQVLFLDFFTRLQASTGLSIVVTNELCLTSECTQRSVIKMKVNWWLLILVAMKMTVLRGPVTFEIWYAFSCVGSIGYSQHTISFFLLVATEHGLSSLQHIFSPDRVISLHRLLLRIYFHQN
jgi:hypothetical protein